MVEDLDSLYDIFDDDSAAFDQRAFQDRYGDLMIVAANEHGELVYATMPTDDPESDGPFVGVVTAQNVAWPLVPLFPRPDVEPTEPSPAGADSPIDQAGTSGAENHTDRSE